MGKDSFKYETAIYDIEEEYYIQATSSFFDEFIFTWLRIASKMYLIGGQRMIETGKNVPDLMHEMNKIINTQTIVYDEITDILEELICGCCFDDVKSIIKGIKTKEYS